MNEYDGNGACPHCGYVPGTALEEHYYLPEGTILHNKYLVGTVLGHGGFGITYTGFDTMLDVKVAVKEYLPSDISTRAPGETTVTYFSGEKREQFEYGLKKFREEAKTLAKFNNHACIVSITDYFNENNTAYLVMEYLDGITLSEYLRENGGKLAWEDAIRLVAPVFDALEVVHAAGLIHRDISPENIFITSRGKTKLLDFGTARFAMGEKSKSLSVILKPGYAPIEQYFARGKQGPWTDIYSLAATLYKLIAGETPPEAVERQMDEGEQLEQALNKTIPIRFRRALIKALSLNPAQRQQSMRELRESLFVIDESTPEAAKKEKVPKRQRKVTAERQKQEEKPLEPEQKGKKHKSPKPDKKIRRGGIIAACVVATCVVTFVVIGVISNQQPVSTQAEQSAPMETEQTVSAEPDQTTSVESEQTATSQTVPFADANLEAVVREKIDIQGEITKEDLLSITRLVASNKLIQDLGGIEYMTNLKTLSMNQNNISDLSALAGLKNLELLNLNNNKISDISALAELTSLKTLDLSNNEISDINVLSGLTNLETLELRNNNISDLNALSGLTNLKKLYLYANNIIDISALSGLKNLKILDLNHNNITDRRPVSGLTDCEIFY